MYSMWIDNYNDVVNYLKNQKTGVLVKECCPFSFNLDNKKTKTKFKIEELDTLTSTFKDEQSFLIELLKYGDKYIKETPKHPIIITHQAKEKIYRDEVIYNDKLIALSATELRRKKRNKQKDELVLLTPTTKLTDFIEYIKILALDPISRPYLLDPDSLGNAITYSDKKALKKLVKDDVTKYDSVNKQAKVVSRGIKSLLREYVEYCDVYDRQKVSGESSVEIGKDLEELNKEINLYFRKDYRNLRNMVAWENTYLRVLNERLEKNNSLENKVIVLPQIQRVNLEKNYRNDIIDKEYRDYYYENCRLNREYSTAPEKKEIKSEKMYELFQEGGYEAVMNGMDADEIYSHMDDAETLGIVKTKKI